MLHLMAFQYLPGVDQLKNVHRFALMAAVVAPIPMAMGIDSFIRKVPKVAHPLPILLTCFYIVTQAPTQHTKPYSSSQALSQIKGGNAIFLPLRKQTPEWITVPASKHKLHILNVPPFETSQALLTPLSTDNAFLNKLDFLSKEGETDKLRLATDYKWDIVRLAQDDFEWVILPLNRLPTEQRIILFLDQQIPRFN